MCKERNDINTSTDATKVNTFDTNTENNTNTNTSSTGILKNSRPEKLNINFDHLSVVSEECLSNSDDQMDGKQKKLKQKNNQFDQQQQEQPPSPQSETSAEITYREFQSQIPPLTHFENLPYEEIGPNVGKEHFH